MGEIDREITKVCGHRIDNSFKRTLRELVTDAYSMISLPLKGSPNCSAVLHEKELLASLNSGKTNAAIMSHHQRVTKLLRGGDYKALFSHHILTNPDFRQFVKSWQYQLADGELKEDVETLQDTIQSQATLEDPTSREILWNYSSVLDVAIAHNKKEPRQLQEMLTLVRNTLKKILAQEEPQPSGSQQGGGGEILLDTATKVHATSQQLQQAAISAGSTAEGGQQGPQMKVHSLRRQDVICGDVEGKKTTTTASGDSHLATAKETMLESTGSSEARGSSTHGPHFDAGRVEKTAIPKEGNEKMAQEDELSALEYADLDMNEARCDIERLLLPFLDSALAWIDFQERKFERIRLIPNNHCHHSEINLYLYLFSLIAEGLAQALPSLNGSSKLACYLCFMYFCKLKLERLCRGSHKIAFPPSRASLENLEELKQWLLECNADPKFHLYVPAQHCYSNSHHRTYYPHTAREICAKLLQTLDIPN